jgi:hypothetical protein
VRKLLDRSLVHMNDVLDVEGDGQNDDSGTLTQLLSMHLCILACYLIDALFAVVISLLSKYSCGSR